MINELMITYEVELLKTVEKKGLKKTVENTIIFLRGFRDENDLNKYENIVFDIVCSEYKITKNELSNSTSIKRGRGDALSIISYVFYNKFRYSLDEIGNKVNKSKSSVSKYKDRCNDLSDRVPQDVKIAKTIEKINDTFINIKF